MIQPTVIEQITIVAAGEAAPTPRLKSRIVTPKAEKQYIHHYTPDGADDWKDLIYLAAVGKKPKVPHDGPIRLDWTVWLPRTEALLKPWVPDCELPCYVKPDRDNLDKAILDALTKAKIWKNDSRVYGGELLKYYVARGCRPGARIVITLEQDTWSHRPKPRGGGAAAIAQTGRLIP